MLVVGLLTGLLNSPILASVQAWLVAAIAMGLFLSMTLYCPLVEPSKLMTIRENLNNSFQLGLGAVSMLLVVLGPFLAAEDSTGTSDGDGAGCGGSQSAGVPMPDINRGVMMCSMIALAINMAILFYDSFAPLVEWACTHRSGEGEDAGTKTKEARAEDVIEIRSNGKLVI
jgi:hypothetical protein